MDKKPIWNPKEKDSQKLLIHVREKIDSINQILRILYGGEEDCIRGGLIHQTREQVHYLEDIFFDLLFDGKSARKIWENRKEKRP